jgi:hypothetical protein
MVLLPALRSLLFATKTEAEKMAVKDKSVREVQIVSYKEAVAKRYAFLKEKGSDRSVIEKDPILKHLKAELSRRQKRLVAVANKVKPKPVRVEEPPAPKAEKAEKTEEKPKKQKKEKPKKPAAE